MVLAQRDSNGFTLIELLVVVAIIGILAAIVISQYSSYRERSFDSRALSDLRNAASAEEAYYADYERYVDCASGELCQGILPGYRWSPGVDIALTRVPLSDDSPESFSGQAFHPLGSKNTLANAYSWNSAKGGLQ